MTTKNTTKAGAKLGGKLLYPASIGKKTIPAGETVEELTQEQFDELVALRALAPAEDK